jgi:hypothetical protein
MFKHTMEFLKQPQALKTHFQNITLIAFSKIYQMKTWSPYVNY